MEKLKNVKVKTPKLSVLKKQCWILFSRYIRLRDCLKTTGTTTHGKCYTCANIVELRHGQAGHFVAGRHNANLFSERGCHLQDAQCNIYLHGNTLEYRRQIVLEYGEGADLELEKEAAVTKKFTIQELEDLIEHYKAEIKRLEES